MVLRMGKQGEFLACSKYPKCKTAMNFTRDETNKIVPMLAVDTGIVCKKCGKPMSIKKGRNGEFLACSGYPDCKSTMNFSRDEAGVIKPNAGAETGVSCAKCNSPMVIKRGRNGEFLVSLALELQGASGICAMACDTDGIDGTENNAGAMITPTTLTLFG